MWSLVYLLTRTLVALIVGTSRRGHDDGAKDLEIHVLRHQLWVLQRIGITVPSASPHRS